MRLKFTALTAAALLLGGLTAGSAGVPVSAVPAAREQGVPAAAADEWRAVCETQWLQLSVNTYSGSFFLADKRGGQTWFSVPEDGEEDEIASGVYKMELLSNLIVYGLDVEQSKEFKRNSETASVRKDGVSVTLRENGFTASYRFPAEGWTIPVRVELEGERLAVSVDTDAIAEETPDKYRITSLCLLPYLGAAGLEEEGYILLPDGSGSLMRFNNGKALSDEVIVPLYGRDIASSLLLKSTEEQPACLPVYGFSKAKGGLLAVVDAGAETGSIHAQPNRRTSARASAYCEFRLRPSDIFVLDADSGLPQSIYLYYEEAMQAGACRLLLYPLGPEEAGYSGMARAMRGYLTETLGLESGASMPGIYLDVYGAVRKRESFLGLPLERTKILSDTESAAALLDELEAAGVEDVSLRYLSWSRDGLARRVEKSLTPAGGVGSRGELLALQKRLEKQGGRLYLDAELQLFYKGGNGVSGFFDISRSLSNAPAYQYDFPLSTGLRKSNGERGLLLSPAKLPSIAQRLFARAEKEGFGGLSLGTLPGTLYADYSSGVMATRSKSLEWVRQALEKRPEGISLLADTPNLYALPYLAGAVNLPSSSSRYDATDRSVPFLQMVFSGLLDYALSPINLGADPQAGLLAALETGAGLHYALLTGDNHTVMGTRLDYLTSAEAADWLETVKVQAAQAAAVWEKTGGTPLHSHAVLEGGVTRTLYENGTAVYINRGTADREVNGVRVPAGGYTVRQEGAA